MFRTFLVLTAATAIATGCGQPNAHPSRSPSRAAASPAPASSADTAFAKDMYAHHRQSIGLDDLALSRPSSGLEVRAVAAENKRRTSEEMDRLRSWLLQRRQSPPEGSAGALGMVPVGQIARVRDADDESFDQLWMQAMITHHRGAVAMARQVQGAAASQDLLSLAQQIAANHQAEIGRLQMMLANAAAQR